MPLPDNGAPWPPPTLGHLYREMRVDDAWYSGDRRRLADVHQDHQHRRDGRRRLWARHRHPQPGRHDTRLHIPLPADIATTSADLLFSEPPTFTVTDPAVQARLDEITEAGGIANTLLEAAEVAAALGGVYLRVTWDASLAARPLLTAVHADCAIPEFRWGQLAAVTFWRELSAAGSTVWRHLERHEVGRILHGLYQGTTDSLGTRTPLTEHPETAPLADSLSAEGDTIETGLDQLTAAYVPNIRPNRRHRGSPFGRSDYQSAHDLFDALDETWSSWLRDIRLARARLIVPDGYLRDHGPGRGASFDDDREIWQALSIPPGDNNASGITLSQFAIRVAEHQQTADAIMRQAVQLAGYSAQSFGLGDSTAATATEVTARERRSMTTRDKKSRYWAPALADMLHVMLRLDRALYTPALTPERPVIVYGDSVSEDPQTVAQTLSLLQQAQAVSTDTKVRLLHPDWDDDTVRAEVDRILAETGQAVPDPMQAGALD
ncbi:phage portal protein [Streptomyces yunnanensis]|uniref:Phage portal protein n=1 Tax=Streptomyces yunnanensis TaxID=156453 RepID=A0ABY8AIL5_9ACTN|nr:phage portal protein [Streptomyces yunnanensis]WEB44024.1 phage portal protein [Streptomyces yunnanensis]